MAYGQRFRNNARREFNRYWAQKTHPPAPDGTRRCADCKHTDSCQRNRRGNHQNCFEMKQPLNPYSPEEEDRPNDYTVLWGIIAFVFILCVIVAKTAL